MSSSGLRVTFLGLGSMGNAMAQNILKKGFQLVVWNRNASKANDLVKAGARSAASAREAVADADVIVSCLYDDRSCLETAEGEDGYLMGIQKGAVHVNTTTISPIVASQLEKLHEQKGAIYVTGTVLGRPDVAAAGQLRSFVAGKKDAVERARPVVEAYSGGSVMVVGEQPAHANVVKLSANMILAANLSLFGQVYALNERWGVDQDVTHQMLQIFYSHPGLMKYEERIKNRDYEKPNGEGFSTEGGLKDVNLMLTTGTHVGVPLPFCSAMRDQFVSMIGNGLTDKDWSIVGDAARINAGLPLPSAKKQ